MDALTYLRDHVPLFAGVSEDLLTGLASAATLQTCAPGHTVLFKGATVDGLHVVIAGRVAVQAKVPAKGVVTLAELGPTEVFGEMSIVEMGTAAATIKTVEAATILMIPQSAFRDVLMRDESFAVRVNTLIRSRRPADKAAAPA